MKRIFEYDNWVFIGKNPQMIEKHITTTQIFRHY